MIELYPGMDIIFEDTKAHPEACAFLVTFKGFQPGLLATA